MMRSIATTVIITWLIFGIGFTVFCFSAAVFHQPDGTFMGVSLAQAASTFFTSFFLLIPAVILHTVTDRD